MSMTQGSATSIQPTFSAYKGVHALFVQIVLITSAVILPIIAHSLHAPVRLLLPMHWPVLLAGIVYGWRAGAITGALAPLISYLVSGYPLPNILPSMTAELFVYGFVAGMLRQQFNVNAFLSTGAALLAGRIVFIFFVVLTNRASITEVEYFKSALLPGIIPAIIQIVSLPFLSQWIASTYSKKNSL